MQSTELSCQKQGASFGTIRTSRSQRRSASSLAVTPPASCRSVPYDSISGSLPNKERSSFHKTSTDLLKTIWPQRSRGNASVHCSSSPLAESDGCAAISYNAYSESTLAMPRYFQDLMGLQDRLNSSSRFPT